MKKAYIKPLTELLTFQKSFLSVMSITKTEEEYSGDLGSAGTREDEDMWSDIWD